MKWIVFFDMKNVVPPLYSKTIYLHDAKVDDFTTYHLTVLNDIYLNKRIMIQRGRLEWFWSVWPNTIACHVIENDIRFQAWTQHWERMQVLGSGDPILEKWFKSKNFGQKWIDFAPEQTEQAVTAHLDFVTWKKRLRKGGLQTFRMDIFQ